MDLGNQAGRENHENGKSGCHQACQGKLGGAASGPTQENDAHVTTGSGQAIIPPQLEAPPIEVETTRAITPHNVPAPPSDIKTGCAHESSSAAKMVFSKSTFAKLRNALPHAAPAALDSSIDPDLISRDKAKQKEAVRRLLTEKIRNDWDLVWMPPVSVSPPKVPAGDEGNQERDLRDPGEAADSESDAASVYSTVSEDNARWRPRAEWTSDLSDEDGELNPGASPFRFDSPDAVGKVIQASIMSKKTDRRRKVAREVKWNEGLACFEARRNAWTGSKMVRVKPKAPTPSSASTGKLMFWRHNRTDSPISNTHGGSALSAGPVSPTPSSPLSPMTTRTSHNTDALTITPPPSEPESLKCSTNTSATRRESDEAHAPYPVETIVPIPAPLLPPQNPMRASINAGLYPTLYDKVVSSSQPPSCPINLGDMIRACVVGWKRDGEWPPVKPAVAPIPTAAELAARRHRKAAAAAGANGQVRRQSTAANVPSSRRKSFGFFSGRDDKEKGKEKEAKKQAAEEDGGAKGLRRGLQKVLSLGHGHSQSGSGNLLSPTTTGNAQSPPNDGSAACLAKP